MPELLRNDLSDRTAEGRSDDGPIQSAFLDWKVIPKGNGSPTTCSEGNGSFVCRREIFGGFQMGQINFLCGLKSTEESPRQCNGLSLEQRILYDHAMIDGVDTRFPESRQTRHCGLAGINCWMSGEFTRTSPTAAAILPESNKSASGLPR